MKQYKAFLKLFAIVVMGIGLLHMVMALPTEVQLGANLPDAVISDPVMDSQNRFYGTIFACFGTLIFLSSTDLVKYQLVFRILMGFFFVGGIVRLVSIALHGLPSSQVIFLTVVELVLPPALFWWQNRIADESATS